jgi:hypothetical protein
MTCSKIRYILSPECQLKNFYAIRLLINVDTRPCLRCFIIGEASIVIHCVGIQICNFLLLGMAGGDGELWYV